MPEIELLQARGWHCRGQPLVAKVPHGHWKTMTFLAALRHDRIAAQFVLDGPINGDALVAYVEQVLVPTSAPGDIVVMDNLGSHKSDKFRPSQNDGITVRPASQASSATISTLSDHGT